MATINLDDRPYNTIDARNYIRNPSGRRTLTGYTALDAQSVISQDTGTRTRVTFQTDAGAPGTRGLVIGTSGGPTLTGGQSYTFAADIEGIGCAAQIKVSGTGVAATVLSASVPAGVGMTRRSVTFTALNVGVITFALVNATVPVFSQFLAFRDAILGADGNYFDGSTPINPPVAYRWSGAVDDSISDRLIRDPATAPITPQLILGYETTRRVRTITHELLSTPENAVTLRAAGLRSGRIQYLFTTIADALKCERFHAAAATITLNDADAFGLMQYVPTGTLTVRLDPETRVMWTVETNFQELSAFVVVPV